MRNKSLFLMVACVCGTIAAIGVNQWMQAQDKGGGAQTVGILVAVANIDKGAEIKAENVELEEWPAGKIPDGATANYEDVVGKFAKTQFYKGEALMAVKLTESSHKVIPKGYNVVALKAREVSIANLIQPGDLVNVMSYFNKSELIPRPITKTVLMGVRVYAINGDTERRVGEDKPKTVNDIQLLIHKNDAEAWTYANEIGKIRLAIGNDDDYGSDIAEDGSSIAGKEFVDWMDAYQREQEAIAREAEAKKLEANKPRTVQTKAAAPSGPTRSKDGFAITKMVEGRMTKYWIEPGKLPVIIEDTGPLSSVIHDEPPMDTNSAGSGSDQQPQGEDDRDVDYSYLNGEDSPFYQPPAGGEF